MKAIDLSAPSTGNRPVSREDLRRIRTEQPDAQLLVVGSWHGSSGYDHAEETMYNGRLEGFHIATYIALTPGTGPNTAVSEGRARCGAEWSNLSFAALDLETSPVGVPALDEGVTATLRNDTRPILYTAPWYWRDTIGNPDAPIGIKLWNAYYDGDPDFDYAKAPYGKIPVSALVGEQYQGTTKPFEGATFDVDYSTFDDAFVLAKPGSQEGLAALGAAWADDMKRLAGVLTDLDDQPGDILGFALHSLFEDARVAGWKQLLNKGGK